MQHYLDIPKNGLLSRTVDCWCSFSVRHQDMFSLSSYSLSILDEDDDAAADEVTLSLLVDARPSTPQVGSTLRWRQVRTYSMD